MKRGPLTALMVMAIAAGFVLAQPASTPGAPMAPMKAQAPMACGMRGMMTQAIPDLTPDQLDKMDALRTAQAKAMGSMRTDLQVKAIELRALWRADEPNANKILAKVKEIGDLRQKMEIARVNQQLEVWKLLTPDQRKAVKKTGMGCGMLGGGMGRGMRGMMRGRMGGQCFGMQGRDFDGPQGPMMCPGGQQGCPDCDMH